MKVRYFDPPTSPRESERPIFRPTGTSQPIDIGPREFLGILAESITLTIQTASEQLARELARGGLDRARVDDQLEAAQTLIEDRRAVLDAHDGIASVSLWILQRHGWLAVREAQLNVRDAPGHWLLEHKQAITAAAEQGADWLERIGIPGSIE